MVCVTKVAKTSLDKALAENDGSTEGLLAPSPQLPIVSDSSSADLNHPLIIRIESPSDDHEK